MRSLTVGSCVWAALVLSACTTTYPAVGHYVEYNELLVGTVQANMGTGSAVCTMKGLRSGMTCTGVSVVTHIPVSNYLFPTCYGQEGVVPLSCDDGRLATVKWTASGCTSGAGEGADQFGNKIVFQFGMEQTEADSLLKALEIKQQGKPNLPKAKVIIESR